MYVSQFDDYTAEWTDEDWRKRLLPMPHRELLALYESLSARVINDDFAEREAWSHGLWCVQGEILERMSHSDNDDE